MATTDPDQLPALRDEYHQTGTVTSAGAVWLLAQVTALRERVERLTAATPQARAATRLRDPAARGECPACHRDFVLTKDRRVRRHSANPEGARHAAPFCPGSAQEPARLVDPDAAVRAAAYREAAELIANHPGPHSDEHHPDAPSYWWDHRDRDAAAGLLRQWADEIHPA